MDSISVCIGIESPYGLAELVNSAALVQIYMPPYVTALYCEIQKEYVIICIEGLKEVPYTFKTRP